MITSSSVSSSSQIDQLVAQYRSSLNTQLGTVQMKRTSLNTRLSVLSDLKTKLNTAYSSARELSLTGSSSKFNKFLVSSSNTTVATATADSTALQGSHTLFVSQLAKADKILTSTFTGSETGISSAEGAGSKRFQITVNGTATNVDVAVAAGQSNSTVLSNIASAINNSGAALSASVVNITSGTSRLVLTSKETGQDNAISLSDVTGSLLSNTGLSSSVLSGRTASTASTGGYEYTTSSSLNSIFKLDGIQLTRGKNSVDDALTGVTLDLKATQKDTDASVELKVSVDKATIRTSVDTFIKNYNDALSFLNSKTSVAKDGSSREILASDIVFKELRSNMRNLMASRVTSVVSGNPPILADIGITASSDGTLSVSDSDKFTDALDADPKKVSDLFNSTGGIAGQLKTRLESFVGSAGIVDTTKQGTSNQITSINTRITRLTAQVDKKVELFRDEFTRLQAAVARISAQQTSLSSIVTY